MEPRFNLYASPAAAKVAKYLNSASKAVEDAGLDPKLPNLLLLRASQINGCGFCTDMHYKDAVAAGEDPVRLNLVAAWREATLFTGAERAALALTEEGTRIADARTGVDDGVWEDARKRFSDDELAGIISLVAIINAYNRLNVMAGSPAGGYVAGQFG
ncbi:carboxymuconolactone decarboxylase family protein [Glycomyces harbinensis]|uniref:Alkylhydroperoxidase AhpD family core domain-containing protein n=1 Tax=Glycomyces harbinensis TaxID=58114 RepID=A0A1G6W1A1_9ACTN|nr:carboxymuconolactone decarboxylase family protein [Glycomyces harbinensis]SDD58805.1 alkylhydroperoxidase AhpD family core domain-containing protein [Glycomyces harbinensis]